MTIYILVCVGPGRKLEDCFSCVTDHIVRINTLFSWPVTTKAGKLTLDNVNSRKPSSVSDNEMISIDNVLIFSAFVNYKLSNMAFVGI